jgi:hypothetical protein
MTEGRRIALLCCLYVGVAALSPVAAAVAECAVYDYWPSIVRVVAAALTGIVAGMVALRAYLDGSYERFRQRDQTP